MQYMAAEVVAKLREADLSRSHLRGPEFSNSVIIVINLEGCDIGVLPGTGLKTVLSGR